MERLRERRTRAVDDQSGDSLLRWAVAVEWELFRGEKVSRAGEIVFGRYGNMLPRRGGKNIFLHEFPRIRVDVVGERE